MKGRIPTDCRLDYESAQKDFHHLGCLYLDPRGHAVSMTITGPPCTGQADASAVFRSPSYSLPPKIRLF